MRTPRDRYTLVSALFPSPEAADRALVRLNGAGLPRDLIEVVVSEQAAESYGRRARSPGRDTLRYAGIGGLLGLVLGVTLSLAALAWPGLTQFEGGIWVQLLGPNVATLSGAVLGAGIGLFARRRVDERLARVAGAQPGILLAARSRDSDEARHVAALLEESGGAEVRLDPPSPPEIRA